MLNAVWVAVIVAVGLWAVLVCAAVYTLTRFARLASQTSRAVAHLRERSDLLIDRGNAAIDRVGEQVARTDAITASMDEVTANMAELSGRVAALAPLARVIAGSAGSPIARVSALAYGVHRAVNLRREGRPALASVRGRRSELPARAGRTARTGPGEGPAGGAGARG